MPASLRRLADVYTFEDSTLEEQGLRWLLASDHLGDGETDVILERLKQLEEERTKRLTATAEFRAEWVEAALGR